VWTPTWMTVRACLARMKKANSERKPEEPVKKQRGELWRQQVKHLRTRLPAKEWCSGKQLATQPGCFWKSNSLSNPTPGRDYLPIFSGQPLNNVALAAALGFLSFAGFEGAATLGEETRNPRRNIPLAILAAVVGTGIFYVAVTYTQTVGFGTSAPSVQAFASSTASLGDFGQRNIGGAMTTAIDFGATISAFASALGTANAGARILFSMGRDGFITNRLGTTSRGTSSPAIAVAVVMIFTFAVILLWSRAPGINGATLFGYLGTIGVFLILVAYILTDVGAIRFFAARRLWRWQWVIPVLAILVLGYTLYSNIYPVPAPPFNIFPYIALAWLVVGLLIVLISLALVRSIGLHLEENEGLRVEEHAGPVP